MDWCEEMTVDLFVTPQTKWSTRVDMLKDCPHGGVSIELGVFRGIFARIIYLTLRPERMYLVDLWSGPKQDVWNEVYDSAVSKFRSEISDGLVEVVRGDIHEKHGQIPEGLAFVHADSGVRHEHIRKTVDLYWPKLSSGGMMAIRGYTPTNPKNGVIEALNARHEKYGDIEVVGITDDMDFSKTILLAKP